MFTVTRAASPINPMRVCHLRRLRPESTLSISKAQTVRPPASKREVAKPNGSDIGVLPCQDAGQADVPAANALRSPKSALASGTPMRSAVFPAQSRMHATATASTSSAPWRSIVKRAR